MLCRFGPLTLTLTPEQQGKGREGHLQTSMVVYKGIAR